MKKSLVTVALALALAGCASGNTDPRDGRVTIDRENCFNGGCYLIYKVCVGPDLYYREVKPGPEVERKFTDSPECEADR